VMVLVLTTGELWWMIWSKFTELSIVSTVNRNAKSVLVYLISLLTEQLVVTCFYVFYIYSFYT